MNEDRELLERAERHFPPPHGGFDALLARGHRKERRRRIASAALAIALMTGALVGAVLAFGRVRDHPPVPANTTPGIGPGNVSQLQLAWTARVGGPATWPTEADGRVFVGTVDGRLYAFRSGCRSDGGTCKPLWVGITGGPISYSTPVVADGTVYVGSSDGRLYAFPEFCGTAGTVCRSRWTFPTPVPIENSGPAASDGVVYVASDQLYAIQASTGRLLWTGMDDATTSNVDSASPAVGGGNVFVVSANGELSAYPTSCPTNGLACPPAWVAALPSAIDSPPVEAGGVVYVTAGNQVLAYPADCGIDGSTCRPLWTGRGTALSPMTPRVADGVVYVSSNDGTILAFGGRCGRSGIECGPLWRYHRRDWATYYPRLSWQRGALFVMTDRITALDCGPGGPCRPLWEAGPWGGSPAASVSSQGVYLVGGNLGRPDGTLYAYELPLPGPDRASPSAAAPGSPVAIALIVATGLAALRRRRRTRRHVVSVEP